eukprot:694368-Amphidinium_carterae.1
MREWLLAAKGGSPFDGVLLSQIAFGHCLSTHSCLCRPRHMFRALRAKGRTRCHEKPEFKAV